MITVSARASLLARFLAAHLVLFGTAAAGGAWAEDAAPASNRIDALSPGHGGDQLQGESNDKGGAVTGETIDTKTSVKDVAGTLNDANRKTNSGQSATDNVDASGGNTTEHHSAKGASGEDETDSKAVRQSGDRASLKPSGTDWGPIDTRITVLGKPRLWPSQKAQSWKKLKIGRSSGRLPDSHRTSTRGVNIGVLTNAIGQPVRQTRVELKGTGVKAFQSGAVETRSKDTGPSGNGGPDTASPRQEFVPLQASGAAPRSLQTSTLMNLSIIKGRDMARPGSGANALGGPAKNVVGVINGTDFHPKHP